MLPKPEFGSGAVKVTPAHDPNDFACGQRHKLEFINILNDDGTINDNGAKFKGMKRYDAREAVVAELKKIGVFRGIAANPMSIAICSRSNVPKKIQKQRKTLFFILFIYYYLGYY